MATPKGSGAGYASGPFAIQIGLNPASYDRAIKALDRYKGAPLAKREAEAAQKTANVALAAIKRNTPIAREGELGPDSIRGELLAKTRVRKLKPRTTLHVGSVGIQLTGLAGLVANAGEVAAYAAGSTSPVTHLVVPGHRNVTHLGRDTGSRTAPEPYVDEAIEPILGELESFMAEQVERLA
jgi:hypothetical protein